MASAAKGWRINYCPIVLQNCEKASFRGAKDDIDLKSKPNGLARMILGLRTAIYPASDLAAAKAWYAKVLGISPSFDQPFYVGFSVGGFELGLLPDATPGVTGPQPLWGVANIESAFARLIELGATSLEPVNNVGEGIKVAAVQDPFGNRFGIIENPNFKASDVR
jgi:predicted enzyme related to lactoylglutathione lyase